MKKQQIWEAWDKIQVSDETKKEMWKMILKETAAKGKKRAWLPVILPLAGCLFLFLMVGLFLWKPNPNTIPQRPHNSVSSNDYQVPEKTDDLYAFILNEAKKPEAEMDTSNWQFRQFEEEFSKEQIDAILPELANYVSGMTAAVTFCEEGTLVSIDVSFRSEGGNEGYMQLSPGEPIVDYVFNAQPEVSYVQEIPVVAGNCPGDSDNIYFASFQLGDTGYYLELHGGSAEKDLLAVLTEQIICSGKVDLKQITPTRIPDFRDEKITLEQAEEDADFGSYLPTKSPEGFQLEMCRRYQDQEQNYLWIMWTSGYSEITWKISYVKERDMERVAAPSETEKYDLSLYTIPYADSVPEEYRQVVDFPLFRVEDISEEILQKRAVQIKDSGDTKGHRITVGILYEGGICVEINSKGIAPEVVLGMIPESA